MNTKLIYEIISGKLLEILENQPKEITNFQQKLDTQIIELQKLLKLINKLLLLLLLIT